MSLPVTKPGHPLLPHSNPPSVLSQHLFPHCPPCCCRHPGHPAVTMAGDLILGLTEASPGITCQASCQELSSVCKPMVNARLWLRSVGAAGMEAQLSTRRCPFSHLFKDHLGQLPDLPRKARWAHSRLSQQDADSCTGHQGPSQHGITNTCANILSNLYLM